MPLVLVLVDTRRDASSWDVGGAMTITFDFETTLVSAESVCRKRSGGKGENFLKKDTIFQTLQNAYVFCFPLF